MMIVVMMMVTMIKMTIMTIVIMVMMSMIFVVMLSTTQSRMWIIIIVSGAFPGAPRHPSGAEPRICCEGKRFGTVGGKNPAPLCNSRVSALVLPYLILLSFCGRATGGVEWKKSCTRGAMLNIEVGGPRGSSRSIAHCSV